MDLNEIKTWLTENNQNEDVQSYLSELSKVTTEGVNSFLETEEGKKIIQPKIDSHFTKGLETWKNNNLEKLINEEVAKRNPAETKEQKKIRELEERLNQKEAEEKKQMLLNKGLLKADEIKLPKELASYFLGEDEDTTNNNLENLANIFNTHIENIVKERLGEGYKPGGNNSQTEMDLIASQIRQAIQSGF